MTVSTKLADQLTDLPVPPPGEQRTLRLQTPAGTEVLVELSMVDALGCAVERIEASVPTLANGSIEKLETWGQSLSDRWRYLLEDLRVLEIDTQTPAVLLRSAEPDRTPERLRYFEAMLTVTEETGQLVFARYEVRPEQPVRDRIPMQFTCEVLTKLVGDLEPTV